MFKSYGIFSATGRNDVYVQRIDEMAKKGQTINGITVKSGRPGKGYPKGSFVGEDGKVYDKEGNLASKKQAKASNEKKSKKENSEYSDFIDLIDSNETFKAFKKNWLSLHKKAASRGPANYGPLKALRQHLQKKSNLDDYKGNKNIASMAKELAKKFSDGDEPTITLFIKGRGALPETETRKKKVVHKRKKAVNESIKPKYKTSIGNDYSAMVKSGLMGNSNK